MQIRCIVIILLCEKAQLMELIEYILTKETKYVSKQVSTNKISIELLESLVQCTSLFMSIQSQQDP